jgi:hypothetical protein
MTIESSIDRLVIGMLVSAIVIRFVIGVDESAYRNRILPIVGIHCRNHGNCDHSLQDENPQIKARILTIPHCFIQIDYETHGK